MEGDPLRKREKECQRGAELERISSDRPCKKAVMNFKPGRQSAAQKQEEGKRGSWNRIRAAREGAWMSYS